MKTGQAIILLAAAPLVLGGCLGVETTPERSAKKAKLAVGQVTSQKGLVVGKANASVEVEDAVVVQDANGVAAVVRVKNTGPTQVRLPVGITVSDRAGKQLYANDTPGLDASLTSLPVLAAGQEAYWVNNQILIAGKAAKVAARVGAAQGGPAGGALPKILVGAVTRGHDEDGFFAKGTVANTSSVPQKRLVITCVARHGARVVAAGRAVIEKLDPAAGLKRPTVFTVFFIGDPQRATLACSAPPTVLSGASK